MSRFNPKLIPFFILSFIAFFMLLDGIFVYFAHQTYTGPYTDNAFQKGLDFDKINQQSIYQQQTAWQAVIDAQDGAITLHLTDADHRNISDATVLVKVVRPATNRYDQVLELKAQGDGIYNGDFVFPAPGQWEIRVKASFQDQEFITSKRVLIPASK